MSALCLVDINLVVSVCAEYTPGGELVYWKWSHPVMSERTLSEHGEGRSKDMWGPQ